MVVSLLACGSDVGRGAGASVPKARTARPSRIAHRRDEVTGQARDHRDDAEDGDDRRRPDDLTEMSCGPAICGLRPALSTGGEA